MGKLKELFNKNKHSLKVKLVAYQLVIFTIFIIGFEIFTFYALRDYYYNNLKSNMLSQAQYSMELFNSSVFGYSLSDVINNERFEFLNNMKGQVQLLDNTGELYYDNTGSVNLKDLDKEDNLTTTNFHVDSKNNRLILTYPIVIRDNQIGVLRNITGTEIIEKEILNRMSLFVSFGILSVLLSIIINYFFGENFLAPIKKLSQYANKLSDGQYNEKSNMSYKGEVGELARTMDELSQNIVNKEEIKTDFISSVSHELRTPLTSIKGWAITLQDEEIDKQTLFDGLKIIEKESDRLSDMVEDLLDFSRYTSPKFTLSKSEFNIIPVIKNINNQLIPRAKEKNINLMFDHNEDEIIIIADSNRLKQVFINLIDNAIKFTNDGGTIISSVKDYEDKVVCEVIDTGIGISEDEIELVTTKFYKGSASGSHTGLGLSICEEIVLRHNGEFEISSVEGEGTTVHFELPKGVTNENA